MIGVLHAGNLETISIGGISEYVRYFIKYSERDVHLFGTDKKGIIKDRTQSRNIGDHHFLFTRVSTGHRRPLTLFYLLQFTWLLLRRYEYLSKIELFYCQRMEFVLPFLFFNRKTKIVLAIHGSSAYSVKYWGKFRAFIYYILESLAIRRATQVWVLNGNPDFGLEYYKRKYLAYSERFVYNKVPIDYEVFSPAHNKTIIRKKYGQPDNCHILLYAGRLEHNPKRVLLLPRVLQRVKQNITDCRMIIIGDGSSKDDLLKGISELELDDCIVVYPYIGTRSRLAELMSIADVSLILSSFEGICMGALESLGVGVPVVATNVGEIPGYIKNDINGIIVPNLSDDDELVSLVSTGIQRILSSKTIKANAVEKYDVDNVFAETNYNLLDILK